MPVEVSRIRLSSWSPPENGLADYDLVKPLAVGSYGTVWLAKNQVTGTFRALKIILADSFRETRPFERELGAIRAYEPISRSHPGLLNIFHVGECEGGFFYVMELADDVTSREKWTNPDLYQPKLLQGQRLPVLETVRVGIRLVEAVGALHKRGLLHRDIKPSNIIYVSGEPKLADIGLVASFDEARSFVGTEGFIPPEGPTTIQADLFALGKVLYELATGLDRLNFPMLPDARQEDHELLIEFNEILLTACNDDPKKRYESAEDFGSDLHLLQSGKSLLRIKSLESRVRFLAKSLVFAIAAALLLLGIVLGWTAHTRSVAREKERLLATAVAKGTEKLQKGDYSGALDEFYSLLKQDTTHDRNHRLRIGSILASSVQPLRAWKGLPKQRAVSFDGTLIAANDGSRIEIYKAISGVLQKSLPIQGSAMALNRKGSKLAIIQEKSVHEYNLPAGTEVDIFSFPTNVSHVAFSPINDALAISLPHEVVIIDVDGRTKRFSFADSSVYQSFFSGSGRYLASATYEGRLLINDLSGIEPVKDFVHHDDILYCASFSKDDRYVVTAGFDRRVIKWDVKSGRQMALITEHEDGVAAVMIDEESTISGGLDWSIHVSSSQEARNGKHDYFYRLPHRINNLLQLNPEGFLSLSGRSVAIVWELPKQLWSERPAFGLPSPLRIRSEFASLDASEHAISGTFRRQRLAIDIEDSVAMIAVNPQGTLLAVATRDPSQKAHAARLYSSDGKLLAPKLSHRDGINFVGFSRQGDRIVTCGEDFVARVWDLQGKEITPPLKHRWQVRWADFSPDDRWLATASWDSTVIVWDAATGDQLTPPFLFPGALEVVVFQGDDKLLVSNGKFYYDLKLPFLTEEQEKTSLLLHPDLIPSE